MVNLALEKPAKRYSEALFSAIADKNFERIISELKKCSNDIKEETVKSFLKHPNVKVEDKKNVIKEAFSSFDKITLDFLYVLVDEDRLNILDEVIKHLEDKINNKNNILVMNVTLAIEPDETLKENIIKRLENKFNSKIKADFILDESIIGGMIVKIKDTVIDLSIRKKMEKFKQI